MQVTVRLFGPEAQVAGARQLDVAVDQCPLSCGALRSRIAAQYPAIADRLAGCRFAVNHEFAADDAQVDTDDEVALIGAVSGG